MDFKFSLHEFETCQLKLLTTLRWEMRLRSDRGNSVQVMEAVGLSHERLLEQLVFLLQFLNSLYRVSQVLIPKVSFLTVEPSLSSLRVFHVLIYLQDELQVLPSVFPVRDQICSLVTNL